MAESINDFIAGYVSGVAGLLVGSPLDVLKVRLQAQGVDPQTASHSHRAKSIAGNIAQLVREEGFGALFKGVASPIVGLAFLNSILFVSYGGILRLLARGSRDNAQPSLTDVYVAGFGAGVACFIASTPTELIKCRAQVIARSNGLIGSSHSSTWSVFKDVVQTDGIRGLYRGGVVTIIRDAPAYGIYFWVYEALKRWLGVSPGDDDGYNAYKMLFAGGMAGVFSWGSIIPLDVIKTRIQTESYPSRPSPHVERSPLGLATAYRQAKMYSIPSSLSRPTTARYTGFIDCALQSYRAEGISVFFKGGATTLARAWPVNAVIFYVYELILKLLSG